MAEAKKIAGKWRRRLVRLRAETVQSGRLDAMAAHLSSVLGIDRTKARGLLLRMQAPKSAA